MFIYMYIQLYSSVFCTKNNGKTRLLLMSATKLVSRRLLEFVRLLHGFIHTLSQDTPLHMFSIIIYSVINMSTIWFLQASHSFQLMV